MEQESIFACSLFSSGSKLASETSNHAWRARKRENAGTRSTYLIQDLFKHGDFGAGAVGQEHGRALRSSQATARGLKTIPAELCWRRR